MHDKNIFFISYYIEVVVADKTSMDDIDSPKTIQVLQQKTYPKTLWINGKRYKIGKNGTKRLCPRGGKNHKPKNLKSG